jgi:hypothetical protein
MKSHFGICLGAAFLSFTLTACDSRTRGNSGSQKSAKPFQVAEPAAPEEDEITKLRRLAEQGDPKAQHNSVLAITIVLEWEKPLI